MFNVVCGCVCAGICIDSNWNYMPLMARLPLTFENVLKSIEKVLKIF